MPTHGERIIKLETIIDIEIPAIKDTIKENHKEIKKNIAEVKTLIQNGNSKPRYNNGKEKKGIYRVEQFLYDFRRPIKFLVYFAIAIGCGYLYIEYNEQIDAVFELANKFKKMKI